MTLLQRLQKQVNSAVISAFRRPGSAFTGLDPPAGSRDSDRYLQNLWEQIREAININFGKRVIYKPNYNIA